MTASESALDLLAGLVLDDGRRWGDVATPWQWSCAKTILDPDAPPNRWESRPRGGSKTTDQAALAVTMLTGVLPAGSECHVFARDLDQARRIRDFAKAFVDRTPGLAAQLKIDRYELTAKSGSTLTIESADAASAYGMLARFVVVDELCQWPETDNSRTLWEAITSGMGKVRGAKLVVITTSGDPGSWSHLVYKHAQHSRRWTVQDVPGPLPWVDPGFIEDERSRPDLTDSAFTRLHLNQWAAGEDRLTNEADLRACITLAGPMPPAYGGGRQYVVTADLGYVNDRSVVAVMHTENLTDPDGEVRGHRVVLDQMKVWAGSRQHPVRLDDVQAQIIEFCRVYRARAVVDPHEAVRSIQQIREAGIEIEPYNFTTASVGNLGLGLFSAIKSHRLAIWADDDLIDELLNVKLVERTVGSYRLDHSPGRHDDRAVCLAMGVVSLATREPMSRPVIHTDADWDAIAIAQARALGVVPKAAPVLPGHAWAGDTHSGLDGPDQSQNGAMVRSP